MKKIYAYLLLSWHFLWHAARKVTLLYRRGGAERFRDNFDQDGLLPLTPDERAALTRWRSCIGCGLCEAAAAELSIVPDQRYMGPRLLAESSIRDLSQTDLALPSARELREVDLGALRGVCPVDIPLDDLVAFLLRIGEETRDARP